MPKHLNTFFSVLFFLLTIIILGCSGDTKIEDTSNDTAKKEKAKTSGTDTVAKSNGSDTASANNEILNAHVLYLGQHRHMKGYSQPYKYGCNGCHGAKLEGGSGPACSKCHRAKWPYDEETAK